MRRPRPTLGTVVLTLALGACAPPAEPWTPDEDPAFDGTAPAPLREPSLGACPALEGGQVVFPSAAHDWSLTVHLPPRPHLAGVLFLHHGNGDHPMRFGPKVGAEAIARDHDLIVVLPASNAGGRGFAWPVPPNDPTPGVRLFDDVLACLDAQWEIDRTRVYAAGFSSGGLWASFLAMHRSSYLAAAAILSGGSDGRVPLSRRFVVNPYEQPAWALPVVLAHGGRRDVAFLDFGTMTRNLAGSLERDGSVVVLCDHGGGHAVPEDVDAWAWPFLSSHRLDGRDSPYLDAADPWGTLPADCTRAP